MKEERAYLVWTFPIPNIPPPTDSKIRAGRSWRWADCSSLRSRLPRRFPAPEAAPWASLPSTFAPVRLKSKHEINSNAYYSYISIIRHLFFLPFSFLNRIATRSIIIWKQWNKIRFSKKEKIYSFHHLIGCIFSTNFYTKYTKITFSSNILFL